MKKQLDQYLLMQGYQKIVSNLPEFTMYFRVETAFVNLLFLIDYRNELYITTDQYDEIKKKMKALFVEKGIREIHTLSLILTENCEKAEQLVKQDSFAWIINKTNRQLVIPVDKTEDYYGFRGQLQEFLKHLPEEIEELADEEIVFNKEKQVAGIKVKRKAMPWMTIALVTVNVIIYLLCALSGNVLYNIGVFDKIAILQNGEYYRIISSMFLHADVSHIFSNMLILFLAGELVERHRGHLWFAIYYFAAGIGGNLLYLYYEIMSDDYTASLGASGAVFGIVGAILALTILSKGKLESVTIGRVAFMIFYSGYSGLTSSYVNNVAHLGGVVTGFVVAIVVEIFRKITKREKRKKHEG
ncbi:MAG: rhomboid family intramembrane serine protease [Lachnospiraceae bacterium]|nr:rhomboid family intramembrane serine protease [Lachnospiraceae bacterium]